MTEKIEIIKTDAGRDGCITVVVYGEVAQSYSNQNNNTEAFVFRNMCDEIELLRNKNKSLTNLLNDPQHVNAMPGGHGCCDICDTGGCCKTESEEI
jgi:hypothetical protein